MTATLMGAVRKRLLTPDASEVTFAKRGFATDDAPAQARLENSALQFLVGFEFAIEQAGPDALTLRLDTLEHEYQGFAYEGAVMALSLRDALSPIPRHEVETFLSGPGFEDGPGSHHIFMAYLGVGFALARLPRMLWRRALPDPAKLADHPTLAWLVLDGYGFHQAFFDHRKWVDRQYVAHNYPWPGPDAYVNRVIDQGIGRAMWFVNGGNVDRLLASIKTFDPSRTSDLICGAGLAATYAGGVGADTLESFARGAGEYLPDVAQGAVFALRARQVAGLITDHNEMASQIFCGMGAHDAAMLAAKHIVDLPPDGDVPAYEVFRTRIQNEFRQAGSAVK